MAAAACITSHLAVGVNGPSEITVSSPVVKFYNAGLDSVASKVTDLLRFGCFFWCDTFLAFPLAYFLASSSSFEFFLVSSFLFLPSHSFSDHLFLTLLHSSALVNTRDPVTLLLAAFFFTGGGVTYCTRSFEIALVENIPDDLNCELLTTVSQR